jgi:hypothetical protein
MPTREQIQQSKFITIRVAFLLLTLVFVLSLIGFLWLLKSTHDLAEDTAKLGRVNRVLIFRSAEREKKDKENSITSCKRNIEGIRLVFRPFFPSPPLTLEERKIIRKFNSRINFLKNHCSKEFSNK